MSNDIDPELEDVREWYIDGRRVHNPFASNATLVEPFDRAIAAHDREIAAKTLEEAADAAELDPYAVDDPPVHWLRARAAEYRNPEGAL